MHIRWKYLRIRDHSLLFDNNIAYVVTDRDHVDHVVMATGDVVKSSIAWNQIEQQVHTPVSNAELKVLTQSF